VSLGVLYSFPTRVGRPGIGTTAWHQVAGLVALGAHVTLYCGSCEKPIGGIHRVVETMTFARLPIPYRLLGDDRAFCFHDWTVARALRAHAADFDVVHGWPLGSLATFKVAKELEIPSLLERPNAHTRFAYDVVAREHRQLGLPVPIRHSHAFNARRLEREEAEYATADQILCPSDFVARTFRERGFAAARLVRHQYGYDPATFGPNGHARTDPRFTVVFVGRCEPRKGLHYALEAWHRSGAAENGRFIICGEYIAGYRKLLEPLLRHPSIEERGYVADVAPILKCADALVLPSVEEGSALVTYEARGAGCVVLASDAAGAAGVDGVDILVHPAKDAHTLAAQLRELNTHRNRCEALARQSAHSLGPLTWSHAARVLLRRYASAVRRSRQSTCSSGAPEALDHRSPRRQSDTCSQIDLSVLIISYQTRTLSLDCLRSIYEQTRGLEFEVIVVDNASTDGSADAIAGRFPQARLIRSRRNLGFAAGNNLAARHARGEFLLLLNPDTQILDGAIQRAVAFARTRAEPTLVGGRTWFGDGSLNPTSCHGRPTLWSMFCLGTGLAWLFPRSRWFDPESLGPWHRDTPREVDAITGCFLLIRRSLWDRLHGFDESFYMYGEETDLCLRARRIGARALLCPEANIIHHGGASERARADKMVRLFRAKAQLVRKHWNRISARFGIVMLHLWALTRMLAWRGISGLRPRRAEAYATWREVWCRRCEWGRP
jgi:GT2 family glycosyltransferase/glycosyltransferase involved in cell wall biosynthesis